jgi:type I restriction enzyme S subunit
MRNISQANLCSARIPLPALPEQKRIAAILDKADAIRRMRRESVRVAEELLRSTFLEMFGDPVTNPKGWKVQPLGDVIEQLEAGWSANGDPRPATGTEFGVLKVSAVTSGYFRPEEHKAVSAALVDRELVTPRAGDLLFSRANTRELVGATCVVESDQPRLFLPDKIWRVVVRDGYATTPYLRFLLSHERFRCELTKTATGTSGSMLNVSMDKLKQLRAPIPPFSVQQRFSAFVWAALQSKARFAGAETDSNNLFDSLLDRAFRGELTSSETVPRQLSIFPVESRRS